MAATFLVAAPIAAAQPHGAASVHARSVTRERPRASVHVPPQATSFQVEPRAQRGPRRRANIGRTWRLADGRAVNADLTPSPEHCAPQIEVRF